MLCGAMSILLITVLLSGSVVSHQSVSNVGIIANNSLEFRTSASDDMTTLITTSGYVSHMEPDQFVPGNILFSGEYTLRTTDGVSSTTIAGSPTSRGNTVGVGQLARFDRILGFCQISPTHVVVVDQQNSCLRLVDRLTLQAPWYAGYCGASGYSQGTTGARFYWPFAIITDKKQAGMLLVADTFNDAIRHVRITVGSGLSAVSEFYKSSTLDRPVRLTQDPISGDLYIICNGDKVFKLTYVTRSLTLIAGSSQGFADGNFGSSKFSDPTDVILIDNGTKLVLSDFNNDRLRLLDLITRRTSSLCTGQRGHSDGDMSSCTLKHPVSLMVLNNTLYVGEHQRIRKIRDACPVREYDVEPDTGLASVDIQVPGSAGTISLSLPPGTYPIHLNSPTANCTVKYHVRDQRRIACPSPDIHKTASPDTGVAVVEIPLSGSRTGELSLTPGSYPLLITSDTFNCTVEYHINDSKEIACPLPNIHETASPDTGVAVVDVPLCGSRTGELSLTPGSYPLLITSDTFNCTVKYNISDYRASPCDISEVRHSASADTEVALVDMSWSGLNGRLRFPRGDYQLEILSEEKSCIVDIRVADHRLRRRLVFEAQYDVQCEVTEGNIAESPLTMIGALHTFSYSEICATDCEKPSDADIELTCTNHTLTVVWPSNLTYTGDVNRIPAELDRVLTSRIVAKGLAFILFLPESTPPFQYPEQEEHGGYMKAKLSSYCIGEDVSYVEDTDSCDQQTSPSNP